MLEGKRIAILIGPQFHDEEATVPKQYLNEKGAKVDLIGLDNSELTGKYGRIKLKPDKTIDQIAASDYDGIVIPGGGAPERIRVNEKAVRFVRAFWQTGRPVGAICHGPQVLITAGVLHGVQTTCYVGIRDDVKLAGAKYVDQEVSRDGQLITSRTPDDLPAFNGAFAEALAGEGAALGDKELDALSALRLAVSREKGAHEFYEGVANVLKNPAICNKFKYLAVIEKGHFEQLSEMYEKIAGEKIHKVDLDKTEIGRHRISPEITSEEAIELAMNAEDKAHAFYRNAAGKSKNPRAKEMFAYLASDEIEHKRLLSVDMASLHGGKGHFQWATHWDVPPGMEDLW